MRRAWVHWKRERTLGPCKMRVHFRATSALLSESIQYSGVGGRQIALPSLGPCFCIEGPSNSTVFSPAVPARRNDNVVAVECIRLVDELHTSIAELSNAPSGEGTYGRWSVHWRMALSVVIAELYRRVLRRLLHHENEKREKVICRFQADCELSARSCWYIPPIYLPFP